MVVKTTKDKFRRNRKLYSYEQLDFYLENSSKNETTEDDDIPDFDDIPEELGHDLRVNPVIYKREQFMSKVSISKFSNFFDFC